MITLEHLTRINKATVALLVAVIAWTCLFFVDLPDDPSDQILLDSLAQIAQVIFFLFGALTIVEVINLHQGFRVITDRIQVRSKRKLLWIMGIIAFFLSAVIDNLTTTIVMIALLRKIVPTTKERLLIGGGMVIAANAGGAWTPIGDVTTTMLWIGGKVTAMTIMQDLFIPSLVCCTVALLCITLQLDSGEFAPLEASTEVEEDDRQGKWLFWMGLGSLLLVPIFKSLTGLPPYMGILLGLSLLWIFTDILHSKDGKEHLKVPNALTKIDMTCIFFFLGILLCIDALDVSGILQRFSYWLDHLIGNTDIIAICIGLISAVVDNIPLVAATMGMYQIEQFPQNAPFWELVAYSAGTGGSILIIGSAAGVVFMGLEKVDFFWFLKKISGPAIAGYFAGIFAYAMMQAFFFS